jgi:aspartyl-tRNA(Asn)/glutamyl-tRNA(Gln) amidotransferase subunit A
MRLNLCQSPRNNSAYTIDSMLQDIVRDLETDEIRSVDVVRKAYECAATPQAAHVFTVRCDDDAHKTALGADRVRKSGSAPRFLGVPITVKDNFDLAGLPTTAGSVLLRNSAPAAMDAPVVKRLRDAGFIILGRSNMTEFAFSGLGLNPHYGTPRNPAFPEEERIPGGSSSGAGVSVGLGIAPAAIGTDTGGSIRIPAALCGLVGFKPTAAAVSRQGVLPLSTTLDSVGVIAKSVACCAAVFSVIADSPPGRAAAELAGTHFAVIENYVFDGIDDYIVRCFDRGVMRLEKAGARITRKTIPALARIPAMHAKGTFAGAESYAWHQEHIARNSTAYDPRVLTRIAAASTMTLADLAELQAARAQLIAGVALGAQGFDALLMPTVPLIAPRTSDLIDDTSYHTTNSLMLRNPTLVNLIDGCAISVPCHEVGDSPAGLSVIGMGGTDAAILALAAATERVVCPP